MLPHTGLPLLITTKLLLSIHIHLHDLRHTGNHFVAEAGANPRELMERMGHSTSRAASSTSTRPAPGSITWPTR